MTKSEEYEPVVYLDTLHAQSIEIAGALLEGKGDKNSLTKLATLVSSIVDYIQYIGEVKDWRKKL